MKHIKHILIAAVLISLLNTSFAQSVNWKSLQPSQRHIISLNAGFDNSTSIGLGYGYKLNTTMPVL
ncbi:MAG TPA: hypothetical protein VGD17_18225, partial [Chitinophagaceae bacterium]